MPGTIGIAIGIDFGIIALPTSTQRRPIMHRFRWRLRLRSRYRPLFRGAEKSFLSWQGFSGEWYEADIPAEIGLTSLLGV